MERDQAIKFVHELLRVMVSKKASDLFITAGFPPAFKVDGKMTPVSNQSLTPTHTMELARAIMNDKQAQEFEGSKECNFAISPSGIGRFRVNAFIQQGRVGLVLRTITTTIPRIEDLGVPEILKDVVMTKRGLIIVVGATGSGKSTTLAAMIDYRNTNRSGHILTLEDPIEYLFEHKQSIVNQREIGVDTQGYHNALPNALREAPDLIMIGEIRDRETMQQALLHTLTGHLCLSTLHANNSYHALSRIINMFPYDARSGLLSDLSIGLRAIIAQRLVRNKEGELVPAVEILLNTSLIAELIKNGEITQIKEAMEQSLYPGSQTFEQALCKLYIDGDISFDEALIGSDSPTNLAWLVNQNSPSSKQAASTDPDDPTQPITSGLSKLEIDPEFLNRHQ
jgi:twitching motility protein PilU